MENGSRPHSRQKTVGTGSAKVNVGGKVNTGSRPVGSGRPSSGGSGGSRGGRRSYSSGGRASGGKLNLKTILIIAAIIIIGSIVLKSVGGSGDPGNINTPTSNNTENTASSGASYADADYNVSGLAREKYYQPSANGGDSVTVMIYMCGTDLESKYGMATKDLNEMLNAQIASNVNIIVETGGCKKWQNSTVSSSCNQIYRVKTHDLDELEGNFGNDSMTDPDTLAAFIKYCTSNYPAERNMLIFWDHGGGSLSGYGYDEKHSTSASMSLSKINTALKKGGCKFDFIGFDACLMATLETALVCDSYADYMIASEESEPGTGWYYTNWISALSKDTSVSTVELSKKIIDDFVSASTSASRSAKVTLSVTDLSELHSTVPGALSGFASSTNQLLKTAEYTKVSDARAGVRQFAEQSKLNQVDLIDLAERIGTKEAKNLADTLQSCVKYNKTTISRSNGLSIYFPYETVKSVKSAVASYNELGIDSEYTKCIQSFASLETAGQITASASQQSSPISGDLLGSLLNGLAGGSSTSSTSVLGSVLTGLSGSGSSGASSVIGSVIGGLAGGSSSSVSPLGSLFGSLVGGSSSSSASTSPIGSLLGSFTGGGASAAGNSIDASSVIQLLSAFSGRSMPSEFDWLDTELVAANAQNIASNYINASRITASEKNGKKVLALTDDEWKLIQTLELNVYVESGDGFVDLGLDNVFEWTDDNDLLLEFDGTWLTLDGNVCAYYLVSDTEYDNGKWVTTGRIPAKLNGSFVNLCVVFDDEHPQGAVTGAYPLYENSLGVQAKGDIEINEGDTIQLLCDYYANNGESFSCTLGSEFKVPAGGMKLENLTVDEDNITASYRLTDIYGNYYWITIH